MNQTTEQAASTEKIPQAAQTPGSMLRRLREKAGLDPATVGDALHLTAHYVKALENDDYDKLPCLTFIKGYLRSYALYLRTDVGPVLASFEDYVSTLESQDPRAEQVYRSHRPQDQTLRWAIVGSLLVVIGLTAGWWFGFRQADVAGNAVTDGRSVAGTSEAMQAAGANVAAPVTEQALAAAAPSARETALLAQASALRRAVPVATGSDAARQVSLLGEGDDLLQLTFNGSSWVEIDDGEQTRIYNDVLRAGDALTVQGEAPFHILLGDAANVEVKLNETTIDFAGDIRADSSARLVLDNNMLASGVIR